MKVRSAILPVVENHIHVLPADKARRTVWILCLRDEEAVVLHSYVLRIGDIGPNDVGFLRLRLGDVVRVPLGTFLLRVEDIQIAVEVHAKATVTADLASPNSQAADAPRDSNRCACK
uniref:Uncharacterized protein n=1 Tax=Oryza punctata TaxID=4537 RepID=A0A0E0K5U6_ORYPU